MLKPKEVNALKIKFKTDDINELYKEVSIHHSSREDEITKILKDKYNIDVWENFHDVSGKLFYHWDATMKNLGGEPSKKFKN